MRLNSSANFYEWAINLVDNVFFVKVSSDTCLDGNAVKLT